MKLTASIPACEECIEIEERYAAEESRQVRRRYERLALRCQRTAELAQEVARGYRKFLRRRGLKAGTI